MRALGDPEADALELQCPCSSCAYFFDIDGTLVELADSPGEVHLDSDIRGLIRELHRSAGGALALITGRPITDVDALFPGHHLPAAGQHGVERRDACGRVSRHPIPSNRLDEVRQGLKQACVRYPGLLIEDKGLSLALHYRRVPKLSGFANRLMRSLSAALGNQYCVLAGKGVVEVKPAGRDKGTAIREFMGEDPFRSRIPLFIGDDVTDEFGFDVVNRFGGYSVKVGPGGTAARWRLKSVSAVVAWLRHGVPAPNPVRHSFRKVNP